MNSRDRPSPDQSCVIYKYPTYTILSINRISSVGSDTLVKRFKSKTNRHGNYLFEDSVFLIKNRDADYFFGLYRHFLFLDSGTGPDGRQLIVYNLKEEKKIFQSEYYEPISIDKQGIVSFWQTSETLATEKNCKEINEWLSEGLGAAIEQKVLLRLSDLNLVVTNETRCAPRQ